MFFLPRRTTLHAGASVVNRADLASRGPLDAARGVDKLCPSRPIGAKRPSRSAKRVADPADTPLEVTRTRQPSETDYPGESCRRPGR